MYHYPVLVEYEQREAYIAGWKDGALVKSMFLRVSESLINSVGDFPLGCWSQQNAQGYRDGVEGLQPSFVAYGLRGNKL